jgi:aldose sugar dehydrogenase
MKFWLNGIVLGMVWACQSPIQQLDLPLLDTVNLDSTALKVEVLADGMVVPWDLEVDSEGFLWIAEQEGKVSRIDLRTGVSKAMLQIPEVWKVRTSGLLGMVSHPDFEDHPFIYLNYTVRADSLISSRLVRYTFQNDTLIQPTLLLEIEGGTSHNGSRLSFGPDGKLYWATGDKHDYTYAQNFEKLNGKILRLNSDGSIPKDNPHPNSPVWALGFRNIQGLVFSSSGLLYSSEHGDAIEDEVNLIQKEGNYGWPAIEGMHDLAAEKEFASTNQTLEPVRSWTPVIAPAGMTFYDKKEIPEWKNTLLLTTLKGMSLRVLYLDETGKRIQKEEILFQNHYGRLRDVAVGPDGSIYISTSNQDWNPQPGFPLPLDDKILKISSVEKSGSSALRPILASQPMANNGLKLYQNYCASCHKDDGQGLAGVFPTLVQAPSVVGEAEGLIRILLRGKSTDRNTPAMPAFSFLKNSEAAEILTYIRTHWGNAASPISAEQLESIR